ncbi:MAG: two-component sensor histidine kinase [Planctomycetaceae bacterium]|nr:two-component sensor histidine kinase [Planctomycetaceae bacterium]
MTQSTDTSRTSDSLQWELAAESITVRIRWFGLCVGYVLVNFVGRDINQPYLNSILTLGAVYALLDSWWSVRGRVFLKEWPLLISGMEAVFISLLCYFDDGLHSPFRFYYFLSVLVCAMRHSAWITYSTLSVHAIGYTSLVLNYSQLNRNDLSSFILTQVFLIWVTWASTELANLVKTATKRLSELNLELQKNQATLEERIEERTEELQESQALLVQQEKQAAFGLLAAGIAHEVGNPLAAISSLVQLLNRRQLDEETREKLLLVDDQLRRIQRTLRELVDFSRPANLERRQCDVHEMINAALNIAKYYKRRKGKQIETCYAGDLPQISAIRDQLIQVFLNLILNALEATEEGTTFTITTLLNPDNEIQITFEDEGHGIASDNVEKLFKPYFTTKETGTGLGLFVCQNIITETCRGRLELTETSPAGTCFTVFLPVNVESSDANGGGSLEDSAAADDNNLSHNSSVASQSS